MKLREFNKLLKINIMKNLTLSQNENYEEKLKLLSHLGIGIGNVVELWKYPHRYNKNGAKIDPKDDIKNKKHYVKYTDQFGVFHSALFLEKHFVTISEIHAEPRYDNNVSLNIIAMDGDVKFRFYGESFPPVEWLKFDNEIEYFLDDVYCFANIAYNTSVLILDQNGKRAIPNEPIIICKKHDFAYYKNKSCDLCQKPDSFTINSSDHNNHKLNPVNVSALNDGIYTIV
jgi:hypothetical protein